MYKLNRYESAIERTYYRAFRELEKLRSTYQRARLAAGLLGEHEHRWIDGECREQRALCRSWKGADVFGMSGGGSG